VVDVLLVLLVGFRGWGDEFLDENLNLVSLLHCELIITGLRIYHDVIWRKWGQASAIQTI